MRAACVAAQVSTAMSMSITFMLMVIPIISTSVLIKGDFKGAIDELSETNE